MKKYVEVYNYYKDLIEKGQLKQNEKLPSVRKSAEVLGVSKTTVQSAYFNLQADGYVIAIPKSGYYVNISGDYNFTSSENQAVLNSIRYDLKSGNADSQSFDIKLWQRYIKSALRQTERLMSYSEVQGEADLREALSQYIKDKRNIITSPDRIIVGAGVNDLLSTLCILLRHSGLKNKTVSFPAQTFEEGIFEFTNRGFEAHIKDKDADVIYVCPSHMSSYGDVMPMKRRIELINYSEKKSSLIIEDDYDSDFVYATKPMPSLCALSKNKNVVYMGSFSNVLIPGIRISFMVLTEELKSIYVKLKHKFAQKASKTEQIALCQYLRDGCMKAQERKIRRIYTAKTKTLYNEIKKKIPFASCRISENGLMVTLSVSFKKSITAFENNGISVNVKEYSDSRLKLVLIPSAIEAKEISAAVDELYNVLN